MILLSPFYCIKVLSYQWPQSKVTIVHREGHFFILLYLFCLSQIILKIMMTTTKNMMMMMMIMTMVETIWVRKICFDDHWAVYLRLTKRWHVCERHMRNYSPKQEHVCLLYKLTRSIHNTTDDEELTPKREFTNLLRLLIHLNKSVNFKFYPLFAGTDSI